MPKFETESVVTQSVLERLIDRDPGASQEAAPTRGQSVRLLKASVRRDLEWLLNTRQTPEPATDEYPELTKSLFNYGLPDFTALSFDNPKDRSGCCVNSRIRFASSSRAWNLLASCPCRRTRTPPAA